MFYLNIIVILILTTVSTLLEFFEVYKSKLSDDTLEKLINSKYGSAINVKQIASLLAEGDESVLESLGFTSENIAELRSVYSEMFNFEVEDVFAKEQYDSYIEYLTTINNKQIENLNLQKEAMQNITKQREYENKLIEAKLKLEDAQKQKKRV